MISRRRSLSGRGKSRNSTRLASSGGISMAGAVRIRVLRFAENFWPTSRRRRTTTGLSIWRWKSLRTKTASRVIVSRFARACTGSRVLYIAVLGLAAASEADANCDLDWLRCGVAALLPERTRPSAIVHSNRAKLRSEQALWTSERARSSSTVSITTMGVEELIRIFRRSIGFISFETEGTLSG